MPIRLASEFMSLIPWVYVNDSMGLCHLYRGFISLVPLVYVIGSMDLLLTLRIYAIYSMDLCH